ncbi:MAG: hypothetical protein U0670_19555 [Anaerolineae bacterium]
MIRVLALFLCILCFGIIQAQGEDTYQLITPDNAAHLTEVTIVQGTSQFMQYQVEFGSLDERLLISGDFQRDDQNRVVLLNPQVPIARQMNIELFNVRALAFSPDHSLVSIVGQNNSITVFDIRSLAPLLNLVSQQASEPLFNIAISPNNQYLAAAIGAPERGALATTLFQVFDILSGDPLFSLDRETTEIDEIFGTGVDFSRDSEYAYLSTSDGSVYKWQIASGDHEVIGENAVRGTRILVTAFDDQVVYLTATGFSTINRTGIREDFLAAPNLAEEPWSLMVAITAHPSEPLVAIGYVVPSETPNTRDSIVQVWDISTGDIRFETVFSEPWPHFLSDLAFNVNGTMLASTSSNGTVRVWGVPAANE